MRAIYVLRNLFFNVLKLSRPASSGFWFVWHFLATVVIVLVGIQLSAILDVQAHTKRFLIGIAAAYWASVILLTFYTVKSRTVRLAPLAAIFLSIFGCFFLFSLLTNSVYSRPVLIACLLAVAVFTFASLRIESHLQKPAIYIVCALILAISLTRFRGTIQPTESSVEHKLIRTSFYNLIARYHSNFLLEQVTGGAIENFGDGYLLATGEGQLHLLSWDSDNKKLDSRKLAHQVPLNRDEFARDTAKSARRVNSSFFRTADILVQDFGDNFRLFASHHFWNTEKQCYTVRVSAVRGRYAEFPRSDGSKPWETVYESAPCLGFKVKGEPFAGYAVGGKLVLLDSNSLLLGIGDHEFDGVEDEKILSQEKQGAYGKTILIDLDSREASIYTMGHRNPQGLVIDPSGAVWLTEHGPKGGDELNLIDQGKNYGWPLVTYGTNYTEPSWPLNAKQGGHEGYERPVFAWLPSIGISAVINMQGPLFKIWKDDLLVSSLVDRSIWRVRVDQGRAIFTERIEIGERIRDFVEDADGRLILWTEDRIEAPTQTKIVVIEPFLADNRDAMEGLSNVERGELVFSQCSGCHRLGDGTVHGIGPDLQGLFNRPIAAAKGYTYSAALQDLSGTWTEKKLDEFLANPQKFTPGTSMQVGGLADPTDRASHIEYLKTRN